MPSVLLENQSAVRRNHPGDETRDDRETLKRSFFVSLGVHAGLLLALVIAAAIPHKIRFEQVAFIELGGVKSAGGAPAAGPAKAAAAPSSTPKTQTSSAPSEIKTASLKPKARAVKQTPAPSEKAEKISVKSNKKSAKDVTKKTKAEPKSDLKERILKKFSAMNAARTPGSPAAASSSAASSRAGETPGLQGIGTDVPFPFASYLAEVRDLITDLWEEPSWLSSGTGGAKAVVIFRITRDGTLAKVLLAVPSGMTALDKSAVQAVEAANPLPPLPEEFKNEYLDVNLEFALTR